MPAGASAADRRAAEAARAAIGTRTNVALIAMDPWSGRVITIGNPESGLFNAYQPCSVFKLVVGVAGLTEGVINPDTHFNCTNGCWISPGHGPINLRRALAVSCNTYFEWVGEKLGFERVMAYADRFGLGHATGIDLPGESSGALPARIPRDGVGHMSAYADDIKTSAMQLGVVMSALVNGGKVVTPRFAAEGTPVIVEVKTSSVAPSNFLDLLRPGMFSAVTEGSAQKAFHPNFVVSGKTGSCSGVGWFASVLGYPRAEMVVVTLVRGGNGSSASGVAGEFYRTLLGQVPTTTIADTQ